MKVQINIDQAFMADEAARIREFEQRRRHLARQIEIDEVRMIPFTPGPLKSMKKSKNPFTLASAYAFAGSAIRYVLP